MYSSQLGCLLLTLAMAAPAAMANAPSEHPLVDQAETLATLRSEVETLSLELETAKEDTRARLQSLDAQKTDLGVQQGRAAFQFTALQKEKADKEAIAALSTSDPEYRSVLNQAANRLRARIETGLPFRTDQRLEALDELSAKIESGQLSSEQSMARLWAFAEDELRLARENAQDRQVISVGNQEVLADVIRLGLVALYFKTPDETVGRAVKEGDHWIWLPFENSTEESQVLALFDGFERGLRTGHYTLPNPITEAQR